MLIEIISPALYKGNMATPTKNEDCGHAEEGDWARHCAVIAPKQIVEWRLRVILAKMRTKSYV